MKVLLSIVFLFYSVHGIAQNTSKYLFFNDMAHFWQAYDKVVLTKDSAEQVQFIQSTYLSKASYELRLMLKLFHYTAADYLNYINRAPKFWSALRERSRALMGRSKEIVHALKKLRSLCHHIQIPDIDFMVGCFEFGGKAFMGNVMIPVEVALADGNFDNSSPKNDPQAAAAYLIDAVTYFIIHETIHTEQPAFNEQDLLTLCVMEGSCDFITELAMDKPLNRPYIILGNKFEKKIWESFKKQMNGFDHDDWLYNKGLVVAGEEDLGYFVGYAICKYYYEHAQNKKRALRRMLNLDFSTNTAVYKFFLESGYENKIR